MPITISCTPLAPERWISSSTIGIRDSLRLYASAFRASNRMLALATIVGLSVVMPSDMCSKCAMRTSGVSAMSNAPIRPSGASHSLSTLSTTMPTLCAGTRPT